MQSWKSSRTIKKKVITAIIKNKNIGNWPITTNRNKICTTSRPTAIKTRDKTEGIK